MYGIIQNTTHNAARSSTKMHRATFKTEQVTRSFDDHNLRWGFRCVIAGADEPVWKIIGFTCHHTADEQNDTQEDVPSKGAPPIDDLPLADGENDAKNLEWD